MFSRRRQRNCSRRLLDDADHDDDQRLRRASPSSGNGRADGNAGEPRLEGWQAGKAGPSTASVDSPLAHLLASLTSLNQLDQLGIGRLSLSLSLSPQCSQAGTVLRRGSTGRSRLASHASCTRGTAHVEPLESARTRKLRMHLRLRPRCRNVLHLTVAHTTKRTSLPSTGVFRTRERRDHHHGRKVKSRKKTLRGSATDTAAVRRRRQSADHHGALRHHLIFFSFPSGAILNETKGKKRGSERGRKAKQHKCFFVRPALPNSAIRPNHPKPLFLARGQPRFAAGNDGHDMTSMNDDDIVNAVRSRHELFVGLIFFWGCCLVHMSYRP